MLYTGNEIRFIILSALFSELADTTEYMITFYAYLECVIESVLIVM